MTMPDHSGPVKMPRRSGHRFTRDESPARVRARDSATPDVRGPNPKLGKTRTAWLWQEREGWVVVNVFVAFDESDDPAIGGVR